MSRWLVLTLILIAAVCTVKSAEDQVALDNGLVSLTVNTHGGAISGFVLNEQGLNPYSWKSADQAWTTSRKEGLFTCFDRVGHPSGKMKDAGVPFHGEATSVMWEVLEQSVNSDGCHILKMRCRLPVANMTLIRTFELYPGSSVCKVSDRIRNDNPFAKAYNVLLHPSIGAPFLDQSVLVDCNASKGFLKGTPLDDLEGQKIQWPLISLENKSVDLSCMTNGVGAVANFVTDDDLGWGCVSNPQQELMAGCLWETADYPWFRVWREWKDGAPTALGIEFGTTPLGKPLEEIEVVGDLWSRPTLEYLEPGAAVTKSFYMFLTKIPRDYSGVGQVVLTETGIRIEEKQSHQERELTLDILKKGKGRSE